MGQLISLFRPYLWRYLHRKHPVELAKFRSRLGKARLPSEERKVVWNFIFQFDEALAEEKYDGIKIPHNNRFAAWLLPLFMVLRDQLFLSESYFLWFLEQCDAGHITSDEVPQLGNRLCLTWLRFLASLPRECLCEEDAKTASEWALQVSLDMEYAGQRIGLRCDSLFSWWAFNLLDVESLSADFGMRLRTYLAKRPAPVAFLSSYAPSEEDGFEHVEAPYSNLLLGLDEDMAESEAPSHYPGQFSAGLHQVAPLLVQLNMMKMNEVCTIENPEVHLHPRLQRKLMEFFIENALIGKYCLIETHSDLMIRRTLRAITEEKLRQSWVRIAFTSVAKSKMTGGFYTAKLETLCLNEKGEVSNWPDGFLDEDEKETEALLQAKYGEAKESEDAE